jgi:hypothetical protein
MYELIFSANCSSLTDIEASYRPICDALYIGINLSKVQDFTHTVTTLAITDAGNLQCYKPTSISERQGAFSRQRTSLAATLDQILDQRF